MFWETLLLLVALFLGIWSYQRYFPEHFFALRYRWLCFEVRRQVKRTRLKGRKGARLLARQYAFMHNAIEHGNDAAAYQVADLLKESFGSGMVRKNEPTKLMALILRAMESKQASIAGYLLDTYQPLLRNLDQAALAHCLRQLIIMMNLAQRRGQGYLVCRIMECALQVIKRIDYTSLNADEAVMKSLQRIGIVALKNRDVSIYQETKKHVLAVPAEKIGEGGIIQAFQLLNSWLYAILKIDQKELLDDFYELCCLLRKQNVIGEQELQRLVVESPDISGMAIMNLRSECGSALIAFILKLAAVENKVMKLAVRSAASLIQMAIATYGLEKSFGIVLPLLEKGRELLMHEIRFSKSTDLERRSVFTCLLQDVVFLVELLARKEHVSVDAMLARIQQCWIACSRLENSIPAVMRFCQGLLFCWMRRRRIHPKSLGRDGRDLFQLALFTQKERERLGI